MGELLKYMINEDCAWHSVPAEYLLFADPIVFKFKALN
jgi:hypothetical protein